MRKVCECPCGPCLRAGYHWPEDCGVGTGVNIFGEAEQRDALTAIEQPYPPDALATPPRQVLPRDPLDQPLDQPYPPRALR